MFMNINIVKFLTASLLLALSTTSCLQLTEDQDSAYGYLSMSELSAEVEVYELVPTKSGTTTLDALGVTDFNQPNIGNVTFTLTGPNDYSKIWTGALENDLTLPVGTYNLKAVYNNPKEYDGLGEALYGEVEKEISITSLKNESPRLILPLTNALVAVSMAEGFDSHFVPSSGECVTFKSGVNEVKASVGKYVFVPTQQPVNVYVSGANSAAVPTTLETNLTPIANTAYEVLLSAKGITMPSITLPDQQDGAWGGRLYVNPVKSVSGLSNDNLQKIIYKVYKDKECKSFVKQSEPGVPLVDDLEYGINYYLQAEIGCLISNIVGPIQIVQPQFAYTHTFEGTDLAGTDAVLNINDFIYENVEFTDLTLKKGDTVMRSGVSDATGKLTISNSWPYLSSGTYTLSIGHRLKDSQTNPKTMSMTGITIQRPDNFRPTVTLLTSSYTSYDKYQAGDITTANNLNPETLFNPSVEITGISSSLMSNTNYTSIKSVQFLLGENVKEDNSEVTTKNYTGNNMTSLSWGSHTLKAKFTFDGKSCESQTKTHHITGLPYLASPPVSVSSNQILGWNEDEGNAFRWESSYLQLGVSGGRQVHSVYKEFHIPGLINISLSSKIAAHNAPVNTTCSILIGSDTIMSVDSGGGAFNYKTTEKEETVKTSMNSSLNKITLKNSYSVTSSWGRIYYVKILYR